MIVLGKKQLGVVGVALLVAVIAIVALTSGDSSGDGGSNPDGWSEAIVAEVADICTATRNVGPFYVGGGECGCIAQHVSETVSLDDFRNSEIDSLAKTRVRAAINDTRHCR